MLMSGGCEDDEAKKEGLRGEARMCRRGIEKSRAGARLEEEGAAWESLRTRRSVSVILSRTGVLDECRTQRRVE